MAFDAANGTVVLFGGASKSGLAGSSEATQFFEAETWTWTRAGWKQEHPAVSPPARVGAAMAFDPKSNRLLLWGGQGVNGPSADFWGWDGSSWAQIRTVSGPPPDDNLGWPFPAPVLIWDSTRNVIELVRNNGAHPAAPAQPDVWYWDESTWTQGSGQGAPAAWGTAAFDAGTGKTVFYGSTATLAPHTYTYDSSGWTQTAAVITPPLRLDDPPPLAFFAPGGHTLAVEPNGDVWSFDGVDWAQAGSGTLPSPIGYAITYDSALHAIVLFGVSQIWSWDGSAWTRY